jgi:hypothetical protein
MNKDFVWLSTIIGSLDDNLASHTCKPIPKENRPYAVR